MAVASSTPDNESTYHRRREERAQQFLSGTSRAAYRLDPLLERSLSTSISDLSQGSELEEDVNEESLRVRRQVKRRVECKRGCPAILQRMSKAYESFGKHTGKTAQYRRSSYPDPKNPERSPRNLTGKCTSVVERSLCHGEGISYEVWCMCTCGAGLHFPLCSLSHTVTHSLSLSHSLH